MPSLSVIWNSMLSVIKTFSISDFLDILLVSYLVYKGIKLVRETRAEQLVKGLLLLALFYFFATVLGMKTMSFLLTNVFQIGIIAIVVLFQPELRRALEKAGRTKVSEWNVFNVVGSHNKEDVWSSVIPLIGEAIGELSSTKTGAIIVVEQKTKMGDLVSNAVIIDAATTPQLLCNLFFPNSPLHDGAVIMREGRVLAAGCFLPNTQQVSLDKHLGSRHRAAIGISENSDALVLVVSEETGVISVAENGNLTRGFSPKSLQELLKDKLVPKTPDKSERRFWRKWRDKG